MGLSMEVDRWPALEKPLYEPLPRPGSESESERGSDRETGQARAKFFL